MIKTVAARFVSFSKEDDAVSAKDAMDGKALLGRPLRISYTLKEFEADQSVSLAFQMEEMVHLMAMLELLRIYLA
ncbi:hypothetical protein POTOM_010947 [Populus tomentosa]|uniref:RRM domain-containing protein n=1 Tax=Populus tomentosa TaxID=118781 RepID=A0A8X8AEG9_POPTO|nr:hypothetical protein POTOM_010947 [Populus tomentosa]